MEGRRDLLELVGVDAILNMLEVRRWLIALHPLIRSSLHLLTSSSVDY